MDPHDELRYELGLTGPVPQYQVIEVVLKDRALSRLKFDVKKAPHPDYLHMFDQVVRLEFPDRFTWVLVRGTTLSKSAIYAIARHAIEHPEEWKSYDLSNL